ncbi:MAG: aminotransferase class IV [Flavobacterium sp.]|nr:aminotransferase class IV [Flavobacterium sp.]
MVNFNEEIVGENLNLSINNRPFLYGDGVFETMKIVNYKILFFEDHYFRLMASMRIIRMEIPMNFTMEYLENEILNLARINNFSGAARVRFTVFRNDGGYYLPNSNEISFLINIKPIENQLYKIEESNYEVELFKDFYITKHLLSTLKTTNKILNVTASIFAKENDYDNCLILNDSKNIVEAINGNIFMFIGNKLITPPISEGCLNGIMRKQILNMAKKIDYLEVEEAIISPFDLQKADELFITNVISGIQPISKYRKKYFTNKLANELLIKLNTLVRLG